MYLYRRGGENLCRRPTTFSTAERKEISFFSIWGSFAGGGEILL